MLTLQNQVIATNNYKKIIMKKTNDTMDKFRKWHQKIETSIKFYLFFQNTKIFSSFFSIFLLNGFSLFSIATHSMEVDCHYKTFEAFLCFASLNLIYRWQFSLCVPLYSCVKVIPLNLPIQYSFVDYFDLASFFHVRQCFLKYFTEYLHPCCFPNLD